MMRPFVSFLVTTPCSVLELDELLTSLSEQSVTAWECLIATDRSSSDAFVSDARIRYIEISSNTDFIDNVATLTAQAQGHLLCFVAPGIQIGSSTLQRLASLSFESASCDIVYTPSITFNASGNPLETTSRRSLPLSYSGRKELREMLLNPQTIQWLGTFFARDIFKRFGELNPHFGNAVTLEFLTRVAHRSANIYYLTTTPSTIKAHAYTNTPVPSVSERLNVLDCYTQAEHAASMRGSEELLLDVIKEMTQLLAQDADALLLDITAGKIAQRLHAFRDMQGTKLSSDAPEISVILLTSATNLVRLARALESLQAQTFTDFEVVLLQNGGADLQDWLKPYATELRIRHIYTPSRLGAAAARSTALQLTRGTYIAYLDDDNAYRPNHLSGLLHRLTSSGSFMAYSYAHVVIEQQNANGTFDCLRVLTDIYGASSIDVPFTISPSLALNCVLHDITLLSKVSHTSPKLEILDDWNHVIHLAGGLKLCGMLGEPTVDIHYELGFRNSQFYTAGLMTYMRAYDIVCLHLPLSPEKDVTRQEYKARLHEHFVQWATISQTLDGFTSLLYALIGTTQPQSQAQIMTVKETVPLGYGLQIIAANV